MFRRLLTLGLVTIACGPPPAALTTEVRLTIQYDSTLDVDTLVVWAPNRIPQNTVEPPLFVEPPGLRAVEVELEVVGSDDGESVSIRVDGRMEEGPVVGSGRVDVQVALLDMVPAEVFLGPPVECGDGLVAAIEGCDDGNRDDGDGCSSQCILEDTGPLPPPVAQIDPIRELERLAPVSTSSPELEPVPDALLTFSEEDPNATWLVLISGTLGSSAPAERTAELSLLIDGEVVDHLGHQTLGEVDNAAGFMTFHVITGAGAHTVEPWFRAIVGETTLSDLRIVAARMPAGADLQFAQSSGDILEEAGTNVSLVDLELNAPRPGPYVILGKTSLSEAPSSDTAHAWMETPEGKLTTFSAARAAWLPAFWGTVEELRGGTISLVGASSSVGNPGTWHDAAFGARYALELSGNPGQSAVSADAPDLGAVYADTPDGPLPVEATIDEDGLLWFAAAGNVPHHLYVEGPVMISDPTRVFRFHDGFDAAQLDGRWESRHGVAPSGGELVLVNGQTVQSTDTFGPGNLVEASLVVEQTPGTLPIALPVLLGAGGAQFSVTNEGIQVKAGETVQPLMFLPTPGVEHRLAIELRQSLVRFHVDGTQVAELPEGMISGAITLSNGSDAPIRYRYVRVRPANQYSATLSTLQRPNGAVPSSWRSSKVVAFRADAFAGHQFASAPERISTTQVETIAALDVGAAYAGHSLLIGSVQVAGESSETGRKSGFIAAEDTDLIVTSHKINRDGSPGAGYHHVAGVADAWSGVAPASVSAGIASPDGIRVDGAGTSLILLGY